MMTKQLLFAANKADVTGHELLPLEVAGRPIALCKVDNRYFAFHNSCTHEEWALSDSYLINGRIVCSLHGAMFDPVTGECERGPGDAPLCRYAVREQGEELFIELEGNECDIN
jgi:nitrite reductase/ring-hydroxylating ferredoxin subunit